jgi:hypothetical protein
MQIVRRMMRAFEETRSVRRLAPPIATHQQRLGLVLLGLLSLASAGVSALLAQPHAALCGAAPGHCGWCYAAAGFAALALAAFVLAAREGRLARAQA